MHAEPRATLRRLSRRDFLRLVASGAGVMSISALAGYPTAPAEAAAAPAATHAPAPTAQPAAAGAPIVFNNPNASQASPVVVSQQGGKLIYGSGGALEQSDPMRAYDVQNLLSLRLFTGAFLEHDDQLRPMPGVMDKWAISDDGLSYTFHLRDGAKWTNGRPITIEDIQWNMNRVIDLRGISGSGPSFNFLEKENVKPLDKSTIQLTLTRPYSPFLSAVTSGYSLFLVAPESPQSQDIVTNPIGTGPYELAEFKTKELMRFKLFKDNWHGITEGFEEIEMRNLADNSVRVNALRAGDVDLINLVPDSEIDRLTTQETANIQTLISKEGIFWWFAFNHTRPPFNDVRVRKAAQLAHDASQVADAVTLGHGAAYEQPFVSHSPWNLGKLEVPKRNVDEARKLLAEAGFPNGLSVKLMLSSSWYTSLAPASQVLQSQLGEAGIKVELEDVEFGSYNDRGLKTDFDLVIVGWDVEPWDPDDYYYNCWHPTGSVYPFLGGAYNNQALFDLLDKARLEPTLDGRLKLYRDAETLLQSDAAGIFSYRLSLGYAWRAAFKGFNMAIRGDWAFRSGGIHALKRV